MNFEAAHRPAPPDCVVIRILADPLDDRLENLGTIRRAALLALNSGRWSPERTPFSSLPQDRRLRLDAIAAAVLRAGPPAIFLPGA